MSKMDKRMTPNAPVSAKKIDPMAHDLSKRSLFRASWPACRSHRSDSSDMVMNTPVTTQPATNSGLSLSAPMWDIYLTNQFLYSEIICNWTHGIERLSFMVV